MTPCSFDEGRPEHAPQTHPLQFTDIHGDRLSAVVAIAPRHLGRDGRVVDDHPVEKLSARVLLDGSRVVGQRVVPGLTAAWVITLEI